MGYVKIKFEFPLYLTEKKEEKERFIFEGFAAANDFDLQNDIISDQALRKCIVDFKKEGRFCLNHTDEEIGKLLECHFKKGKIWVKTEVTKKSIIKKVKSGELNCLSIKGQIIKSEKVELLPDLRLLLIKELHLIEVSLVPQGANPEARAIRWYIMKAIEMAEANKDMKKKKINLTEEEPKEETEEESKEETSEETEEEKTEEETEKDSEEEDEEDSEEESDDEEDEEESEEESEEDEKEKSEEETSEKPEGETEETEEKEGEEKEEETKSAKTKEGAVWTAAYINDLPNSSFAYIEAGGKKNGGGKTVPRSLRHLPYKDASGKVDLPHLRNAIARAPHVKGISAATVKRIQSKLRAILAGTKKSLSEDKEEKIVYSVMNSGNIELEDKKEFSEFKKELMRVGKWQHGASRTGVLDITKEMLKVIVKNFKDKVLDNIFVPLGHPTVDDPSKNIGEVAGLELSKDENKLIARIDVKDETVAGKIKKGLIKGISASFAENYIKKDTGEKIGPTLFHAALVNEPYIKGMESFVPLSDDLKDSIVIPIMNIDVPLTLAQMAEKIQKLEEAIKLNDETTEETSEEETSEEGTPKEDDSKKSESSEVGKEAKDEEEEETEETSTEEPETEETKTEEESEEAKAKKEGVELAEAEKIYEELLKQGKVTPAEKDLLLPLLASTTPVELADGKKVDIRKAMKKYLNSKSPIFSLEEFGTIEGDKTNKDEKVPEDVKEEMDKMGLSEDIQKETWKDFKKGKEEKGKKEETESTPF